MTEYIIRRYLASDSRDGRKKAGIILSVAGIAFNLLLFILKTSAGSLSDSIAITADGFNNLADSGACLMALLGFELGDKPADKRYPCGYGRFEYLSGLLISAAVIFIGGRMLYSSIGKIIAPEPVGGGAAVIAILLISVAVKGYMYCYNRKIGRLIHSSGMRAAALDSLSDCVATLAILAAVVIERLTGFQADGYTGVLVAVCILYAGITSARESLQPLLGRGIDKELSQKLDKITEGTRVYRAAVHDYGPHKKLLTMYLSDSCDAAKIPKLRERIQNELKMEAVICPCAENKSEKNKTHAQRQE